MHKVLLVKLAEDGANISDWLRKRITDYLAEKEPERKVWIDPGFRFHDLRHTFASHQKMAGTDAYTIMDIMGHSDHRMMRRYAHLTPEHKKKAVNSLPKWQTEKVWKNSVIFSGDDENCNHAMTEQPIELTRTNVIG
jgi:integrase